MNWFTRSSIDNQTTENKQKLINEDSACEHVQADASIAKFIHREMDTFGPVSSHCVCEACDAIIQQQKSEEICVCNDCSGSFPRSQVIMWKWYDFYAPQGDIPICVCNSCRGLPKHQERVRKDQEDYDWEFGSRDLD